MADLLIYFGVAVLLVAVIGWLLLGAERDIEDDEDDEWDEDVIFTTSYPRIKEEEPTLHTRGKER